MTCDAIPAHTLYGCITRITDSAVVGLDNALCKASLHVALGYRS